MCQPSKQAAAPNATITTTTNNETTPPSSTFENLLGKVWPLPPLAALSLLLSLLPTYFYLNRGFTQWFFWVSILYLLTQSKFLQKFQVLIGTSICLGWYASLTYEYFQHGRFMDVLYKNMPEAMTNNMLLMEDNQDGGQLLLSSVLDYQSTRSLLTMMLAHILKFWGIPCKRTISGANTSTKVVLFRKY
jgi:hypothetical protein